VKNIFKRLFRVYAHIYHSHFPQVAALGEEAHLNTSFKHFIYLVCGSSSKLVSISADLLPQVNEFQLIEKKELAPLDELIKTLVEGV
jgi:MOB kinase activator 1